MASAATLFNGIIAAASKHGAPLAAGKRSKSALRCCHLRSTSWRLWWCSMACRRRRRHQLRLQFEQICWLKGTLPTEPSTINRTVHPHARARAHAHLRARTHIHRHRQFLFHVPVPPDLSFWACKSVRPPSRLAASMALTCRDRQGARMRSWFGGFFDDRGCLLQTKGRLLRNLLPPFGPLVSAAGNQQSG